MSTGKCLVHTDRKSASFVFSCRQRTATPVLTENHLRLVFCLFVFYVDPELLCLYCRMLTWNCCYACGVRKIHVLFSRVDRDPLCQEAVSIVSGGTCNKLGDVIFDCQTIFGVVIRQSIYKGCNKNIKILDLFKVRAVHAKFQASNVLCVDI